MKKFLNLLISMVFWSAVLKINFFITFCWVNKDENIYPNKFSQPIGQYVSHSYWKQIYCLVLSFLILKRIYLFEFSNINSRIMCKISLKLTIEASGVFLVSLLLPLNIFDVLFWCCCFCWLWTCIWLMEYFIALIKIYLCISESDLGAV